MLNGSITALTTPCDEHGDVDRGALRELVRFQAGVGIVGLFVLGTAGQGPMFSATERQELAEVILAAAGGDLEVVVHVGSLPTDTAVQLARHAADAGARAISSVPPVYYQPDFESVRRYYAELHEAAPGVPLLAYNNPPATGYDLRPEQAADLLRDGIIHGVKQASASVADLHALLRAGVPVWMANAGLNTAAFAMGAEGSISTITNVVPELFVGLYDAMARADLQAARELQHRIDGAAGRLRVPIIGALHSGLTLRGLPGLAPRRPLRLAEGEELARVQEALDELLSASAA